MELHVWCLPVLVCFLTINQINGQGGGFDLRDVDVRLRGGLNDREGRVEVYYQNSWGTICDDSFDVKDAAVVCRHLGIVGLARAYNRSFFGRGTGRIWMDEVACSGNEPLIQDCPFDGWGNNDCEPDHSEDAGVSCLGERQTTTTTTPKPTTTTTPPPRICNTPSENVRLVGGPSQAEGKVEVRQTGGNWGEVCDDRWGVQDAQVICRALCYHPDNARAHLGSTYANATLGYLLDEVRCTGSEDDIFDCPNPGLGVHNCDITEAAGVSCLQDAPTPPPLPSPEVVCTEEKITAKFSRTFEPRLQTAHLTVSGAPTDCNYETTVDANYVSISIPFVNCGTVRELNLTHIWYSNVIRHGVPPRDPVITRTEVYLVPVYCVLFRNGDAVNEVDPEGRTAPPVGAEGKFDVQMFLYRSNRFQTPIQSFPAKVSLGDWVYVGISLTSSDTDLKLTVPQCYTSPSTQPETEPQYFLLRNKCPLEPSVTVYPVNETMYAFRFQSFRFIGNYSYLYLHCKALVCEMDEKDGWCDRTCIPGAPDDAPNRKRGKRDVSLIDSLMASGEKTIYHVEKGPLYIVDPSESRSAPGSSVVVTGTHPVTSRLVTRSTLPSSESPKKSQIITTPATSVQSSSKANETPKDEPQIGGGEEDIAPAKEIKDAQTGASSGGVHVTIGLMITSLLVLLLH